MIPPPPHFLSGYPIHETGKYLYPQVALVLPSRSDRNGVPRNVFQQLVAVGCRRSDKLLAERHRHLENKFLTYQALENEKRRRP